MLPTHLNSVVACGRGFPCCNCDDSVLIIIKSTCMTGCGPLMGALFHQIAKNWGMVGGVAVLVGRRMGEAACTCVRLCESLVCADLWLIND